MRLGFRQVLGVSETDMKTLVGHRGAGYDSIRDLWLRTGLGAAILERLADADAFRSLGLDRRMALWAVRGLDRVGDQDDLPLFSTSRPQREREPDARLPPMPLGAHVVEDYRRLSLSLKAHPVAFMRRRLEARGILRSEALAAVASGKRVTVAGLVLVRQRPGTASGVIFMTIEDETGIANIIVWPKVFERLRAIVIGARFVAVTGKMQSESGVIHVVAERMEDLTPMLGLLSERGGEIDPAARADEARTSRPDPRDERPGESRLPAAGLVARAGVLSAQIGRTARPARGNARRKAEFSLSRPRSSSPLRRAARLYASRVVADPGFSGFCWLSWGAQPESQRRSNVARKRPSESAKRSP